MSIDRERGGLIGLKKPLVAAAPVTDPALERTVLSEEVTGPPEPPPAPPPAEPIRGKGSGGAAFAPTPEELTKPATFHLPLSLLQRLRATCRLKNTTMVDFVRHAIEGELERQRPTEEEIRRLLGR